MKQITLVKMLAAIAAIASVSAAFAQQSTTTTTTINPVTGATTTTESSTVSTQGTITTYTPSSDYITFRAPTDAAPVRYYYDKQTTILDPEGRTVTWSSVRPDEPAAEPELLLGKAHLGDRQVDRLQRQHRHAEEAVRIGLAIIGEPAVVGPAGRGGELRVMDRAGEQAEARIKKGGVDAVGVHVGDPLVRIEPAGLAVLVLHRVVDDALPGADRANPSDAALSVADPVLLNDEPLFAVLLLDNPRRPVAERRVDVLVP